jgi:Tfp pilus assembly protein PilF
LIRRANAYANQGQMYSAKSDIKSALSIDPNDPKVQKILNQYKNMD